MLAYMLSRSSGCSYQQVNRVSGSFTLQTLTAVNWGAATYRKFFMVIRSMDPSTNRPSPSSPSSWLSVKMLGKLLLEVCELLLMWLSLCRLLGSAMVTPTGNLQDNQARSCTRTDTSRALPSCCWKPVGPKRSRVYTKATTAPKLSRDMNFTHTITNVQHAPKMFDFQMITYYIRK